MIRPGLDIMVCFFHRSSLRSYIVKSQHIHKMKDLLEKGKCKDVLWISRSCECWRRRISIAKKLARLCFLYTLLLKASPFSRRI